MAQFILKIKLGYAEMLTGYDIEQVLKDLHFERYYSVEGLSGCVRGVNGNVVGSWMVK